MSTSPRRFMSRLSPRKFGTSEPRTGPPIYKKAPIRIMAKILIPILTILVFAIIYFGMMKNPNNFNTPDNFNGTFLDAFYFSFTTMSTVGYGDISPKSSGAKVVVMLQQAILVFEILSMITGVFETETCCDPYCVPK